MSAPVWEFLHPRTPRSAFESKKKVRSIVLSGRGGKGSPIWKAETKRCVRKSAAPWLGCCDRMMWISTLAHAAGTQNQSQRDEEAAKRLTTQARLIGGCRIGRAARIGVGKTVRGRSPRGSPRESAGHAEEGRARNWRSVHTKHGQLLQESFRCDGDSSCAGI